MSNNMKDLFFTINLLKFFYSSQGPVFSSPELPRSLPTPSEGSKSQEQCHEESSPQSRDIALT